MFGVFGVLAKEHWDGGVIARFPVTAKMRWWDLDGRAPCSANVPRPSASASISLRNAA